MILTSGDFVFVRVERVVILQIKSEVAFSDASTLGASFKEIMGAVWAGASASNLQSRCGDRHAVTVSLPTDIGFIIGTSFGNGYRLTGEPAYKEVLTTAGKSLEGLYNPTVGALRSWTFKPYEPPNFAVIIDSMMTLGPLQWAGG